MNYLMFESIWLTVGVCIVGAGALLVIGRGMEPRRRSRFWLGWAATVAALFIVQSAVTTEREQVRIQLDRFIRAISDKDAAAIAANISSDYSAPDFDRERLLDWIRQKLEVVDVDNNFIRSCRIDVTGEIAEMRLVAVANLRFQGLAAGLHTGEWTLTWRRGDDGWRILSIVPHRIDDRAVRSLGEINP